jgi:UDP-glucose 4-epimerase
VFPSTGSIYGENIIPTPENAPMPIQTSFYGASKLAGEGLIQAYCEAYGFKCWIYRFVSILGERYTHGHVYDFYMQLKEHSDKLFVLGNGEQRKSYLYVKDCVDGILWGMDWTNDRINIFNLGKDFTFSVDDSIDVITSYLGVNPEIEYSSNENKGWVGDIPHILLDCTKIKNLGWIPEVNITKSIQKTLDWLKGNR